MSVCFGASLRIVNVNVDGGVRSHLFMSPDNNNDLFTKTFEFLLFIFLTLEMITYVRDKNNASTRKMLGLPDTFLFSISTHNKYIKLFGQSTYFNSFQYTFQITLFNF